MNELERAARDLVANPDREPTPLAQLEVGAARQRRRSMTARGLSVAASIMVVVAGAAVVARARGDEVEVRLGGRGEANGPLAIRVSWDDPRSDTATTTATLVEDRLRAYGATDIEVVPAGAGAAVDVRASGISFDDARLLLETQGRLMQTDTTRATDPRGCTGNDSSAILREVGWPEAKTADPCYLGSDVAFAVTGGRERWASMNPIAAAEVRQVRNSWSIEVRWTNGGPQVEPSIGSCRAGSPPLCAGLLLDGVLLREPDATEHLLANEEPPVTSTDVGFTVRGFNERDAKVLAAILRSGPPVSSRLHIARTGEPSSTLGTRIGATSVPTNRGGTFPHSGPPPGTTAPDDASTEVFVARGVIKRGTSGSVAVTQRLVADDSIPVKYRPGTAIRSTDEIAQKVALFEIAPNTIIVAGMFVDP